jgi:hypothetical protein
MDDIHTDMSGSLAPARMRARLVPSLFSARFTGSSNSMMSGLAGPGRVLGHAFAVAGRRVEAAAGRAAAVAGLGVPGAAARVLAHLRGRHVACEEWSSLAERPVDMAVELGNGFCMRCEERYYWPPTDAVDDELDALLARILPVLEQVPCAAAGDAHADVLHSDAQPVNCSVGARFLAVLAMSHSTLRAALLRVGALPRAELALVECKRRTWDAPCWDDSVCALDLLVGVLDDALPAYWFDTETWSFVPAATGAELKVDTHVALLLPHLW